MIFRRKNQSEPDATEPPPPTSPRAHEGPIAIREFVYLDQVSVYSLASAAGQPMLVGEVETNGKSMANRLAANIGLSAPIARVGASVGTEEAHNSSFQVESKYNVQSTFAALRDLLAERTKLRENGDMSVLAPANVDSLARALPALQAVGLATPVDDLMRGTVVELPIELVPHNAYTARSVVSEMRAMSEAAPNLLKVPTGGMSVRELAGLMDWLLGDLVPIEGRATRHELVDLDGASWLICSDALAHVRADLPSIRPLTITGVTQSDLYWQDIRRTVFSGQTYTVMGRVNRAGVHSTWDAVKTLGSLRRVMPDEKAFANLSAAFDFAKQTTESKTEGVAAWCLDFYARMGIAVGTPSPFPPALFALIDRAAEVGELDIAARSEVLREATGLFVAEHPGIELDPSLIAGIRSDTLADHGLLVPIHESDGAGDTIAVESPDILELEIVAAYW